MLRARWLGRVPFAEAEDLQRALHARAADDYLLLLEHPHVYTLGSNAKPEHVLVPPASVGADVAHTDRGGDVTYHGPGQLVGYPIVTLPEWRDGLRDVVAYVRTLEAVLIDALGGSRRACSARAPLSRCVGRRREDRRGRCEGGARPYPARIRAQRRSRPVDVRAHRAVRDPRPRGHVAGARAGRAARDADGGRRRRRNTRHGTSDRSTATWSARTSCGASTSTT